MKAIDLKRHCRRRLQEIEQELQNLEKELQHAPTCTIEIQIKSKASQLESVADEIYSILDVFGIQYKYIQKFRHGKFTTK